MIGDVMRIQRTPRSMPAVFSPRLQTLVPRLPRGARDCSVETEVFWGVKWFGNATAVSSHDSLPVLNGDYPLEFNWCVLVKLPRLFFVSDSTMRKTRVSTLSALLIPCALAFTSELLSREETDVVFRFGFQRCQTLSALLIPFALAFTSELLSREETEVLGSYGSANATAVSSHDSLLVPNGDYALEFNWCVMCGVNFYTNF